MEFFCRTRLPETKPVPCGAEFVPIYEPIVEDGVEKLVKSDRQRNLREYVHSSEEQCLIYNILDRFTKGDVTALNHRKGQFIDVTGMPTTLAEAQQLMIKAQTRFDHLSDDEKAKFHYNVTEYINEVATATPDKLKEIFGVKDNSTVTTEEVTTDVA